MNELLKDAEYKIISAPMNEMANLYPSSTGLGINENISVQFR